MKKNIISEEEQTSLAVCDTPIALSKSDENPYQFRAREGDFVRLPNGRTGRILMIEFYGGGKVSIVFVWLDKPKDRRFGFFSTILGLLRRFVNEDINQLELIATREELEANSPEWYE